MELTYLTYQIILEELNLEYRDYSVGGNTAIKSVELFEPGRGSYDPDALYVATLRDAASASGGHGLCFICVNDGGAPSSIVTDNIIAVVNDHLELPELANRVYAVFVRLMGWITRMQRSVIEREGVQALLDISDDVLRTTVTVLDSTYKLLAYSYNWAPYDPVNSYLIEHGFHSEETMAKFRKTDRFKETESTNDVVVSRDRYISNYVTVKKYFKHSSIVSIYTVMVCNHRELTPGLLDLFRIINSFIDVYAKRGYPYDGKYSAFDALLHDMLDNGLKSPGEIEQRAERAELPFTGIFDCYKIAIAETASQSVTYLALKLSGLIEHSFVSFYQNAIIVLNVYRNADEAGARLRSCREILGESAGESIRSVGISNVFTRLDGFTLAYRQAEAAVSVGDAFPSDEDGLPSMLRFEDCYLRHMLQRLTDEDEELYCNCEVTRLVRRLVEYSKARNYNYVGFLLTYLMAERRSSDVGELLHLHRNTVIYHIAKIEELFSISLDDPQLRLKLIVEINRHYLKSGAGGQSPEGAYSKNFSK